MNDGALRAVKKLYMRLCAARDKSSGVQEAGISGLSVVIPLGVTAGSMQWSKAQSSKNLMYWKILSYGTK
jgi:hypothetical protein